MAAPAAALRMSRKGYEARVAVLRAALVQMQVRLKAARIPGLVVIAGVDGAGKGDVVNVLNAWLDPRGVETHGFHPPTDEERERPAMWRYWRCVPPRGRLALYAGGWHADALRADPRRAGELRAFGAALVRIARFEELLAADGAMVAKIWLDLSKAAQGARLVGLESDPRTAWRVTPEDWQAHRDYERLGRLAARMRRATDRPGARWRVIDAADPRRRNLAVGEQILAQFRRCLRAQARLQPPRRPDRTVALRPAGLARLRALPLDQELSAESYEHKRDKGLGRLNRLVREAALRHRSVVWVFEGWDAAGKGGAIRRLTDAIDARDCRVIPIAKPTEEEKAHHYLWRFWRHVPRAGLVTIYDRSWYGRILVERLEGFARPAEWRRAFAEIVEFERELVEHGVIVLKFWLQISKAEQLRRFRDRAATEYKRHKIDAEDWRNRRKWAAYETAVGDMLALTETRAAPWHLIPAENKRHARLQIIRTSCERIRSALRD